MQYHATLDIGDRPVERLHGSTDNEVAITDIQSQRNPTREESNDLITNFERRPSGESNRSRQSQGFGGVEIRQGGFDEVDEDTRIAQLDTGVFLRANRDRDQLAVVDDELTAYIQTAWQIYSPATRDPNGTAIIDVLEEGTCDADRAETDLIKLKTNTFNRHRAGVRIDCDPIIGKEHAAAETGRERSRQSTCELENPG